ncbi:hypothetical protein [Bailinhaonella thermotolerans]|uniref:hypothetical protein n=1 Tax=Bailinhaonella thermotolerans TaxID=1070861 RepID=UPI00192A2C57|nr:hypothetical protein [Bailinhaonella thermotolerans]
MIAIIIGVLIVVLVGGYVAWDMSRRRRLQQRFGPEYDRAVKTAGGRREAEAELSARERRFEKLDIRDLSPEETTRYSGEWTAIQERFVDAPEQAVAEADRLVTQVMADRGYPTDSGHRQRIADLSVGHAKTLGDYRAAHEISERSAKGEASTEDLRQAMIHYRELFADLLGTGSTGRHAPPR